MGIIRIRIIKRRIIKNRTNFKFFWINEHLFLFSAKVKDRLKTALGYFKNRPDKLEIVQNILDGKEFDFLDEVTFDDYEEAKGHYFKLKSFAKRIGVDADKYTSKHLQEGQQPSVELDKAVYKKVEEIIKEREGN